MSQSENFKLETKKDRHTKNQQQQQFCVKVCFYYLFFLVKFTSVNLFALVMCFLCVVIVVCFYHKLNRKVNK